MNRIFIEARREATPECQFLKAVISRHIPSCECRFVCMDGFTNLFREAIVNQLCSAMDEGDNIIVLLDADTPQKDYGGFTAKNRWTQEGFVRNGISVPCFLYPDNNGDGDVESLMESIARRDIHQSWFDCFEDYESCVSGMKADDGTPRYNTPNRKGKLHTYISSQQLTKRQRDRIGCGEWLFADARYWDLSSDALLPLRRFLEKHLK